MRLLPTFLVLLVGGASVPFAQAQFQFQFQPLNETEACPAGDYVDCRGGDAFINGTRTTDDCFTACEDGTKCCFGTDACKGTTACIEKSPSANPDGDRPCKGGSACENVGNANSKPIISSGSCRGFLACYQLAHSGGSVTSIEDSCTANYACYGLARSGGSVTSIEHSCTAYRACFDLANEGSVGEITGSCCGANSCREYCKDGSQKTGFPTCGSNMTNVEGCVSTTSNGSFALSMCFFHTVSSYRSLSFFRISRIHSSRVCRRIIPS